MASPQDYRLFRDVLQSQHRLEDDLRQKERQNRRAGLGSTIGSTGLSLLAAALAAPTGPLGMAAAAGAGSRIGSELGEQAAGGYAKGNIDLGKFHRRTTRDLNRDWRELRGTLNTTQWTDSLSAAVQAYLMGGGQFKFGNDAAKVSTGLQEIGDHGYGPYLREMAFPTPADEFPLPGMRGK